ncbi:hypothetical protein [Bradyrhizobium icense]|uniref:Uncharacterized protein n=1 Tax=Bradyrhizobium icense TaxID=1274631 RepID=A0A1B1UBH5_9BRAD|nr:hypothetical protein [Bradyrhizobium icense]ANW00127.1 hypothetical protein LMTR13_07940 [Bradyrhizobium icense]
MSGTRRLPIYFAFKSGIIADKPQPNEIRAFARRIEGDLLTRKLVNANISMNRKTIETHVNAAFDELRASGKTAPKPQEAGATLIQRAQCLLG